MDSDLEIEFIEKDSGMSSLDGSKDETPERRTIAKVANPANGAENYDDVPNPVGDVENYDDEPDETIAERLWGLTEMFPEQIRNFTENLTNIATKSIKGIYTFSLIFETERAQMEEMQKSQQKQVLLGPGTAISSTGTPAPLPLIR